MILTKQRIKPVRAEAIDELRVAALLPACVAMPFELKKASNNLYLAALPLSIAVSIWMRLPPRTQDYEVVYQEKEFNNWEVSGAPIPLPVKRA